MMDEKRKAGRPVGSGQDRTILFRLRLNAGERAELDRRAEEAGQTPSQWLRERIEVSK